MDLAKVMIHAKKKIMNPVNAKRDGISGLLSPITPPSKTEGMESSYDPYRTEKLLSDYDDGTMGTLIENIKDEKFKSDSLL